MQPNGIAVFKMMFVLDVACAFTGNEEILFRYWLLVNDGSNDAVAVELSIDETDDILDVAATLELRIELVGPDRLAGEDVFCDTAELVLIVVEADPEDVVAMTIDHDCEVVSFVHAHMSTV